MGRVAGMQISPDQGLFLRLLITLIGARRVLEIGTFTGFSSLMMAYGGAEEVVCLDISEKFTSVARRYWAEAGVDGLIDLRIGPAVDSLKNMDDAEMFDFVFIDADKDNYLAYFELSLVRLKTDGLIAVDNTLWAGKVLDPSDLSPDTVAIRSFNEAMARDDRVETLILPIGDGLTLIRRK